MKRTIWMAIGALILAGANAATGQSLGDYARDVRKNKPEPSKATRHYDDDNLPSNGTLSVVGPEPAAPKPGAPSSAAQPSAADPNAAQKERQKAEEDMRKKITEQQGKVSGLTHELDLDQREYRLRSAQFYSDAGNRLRNSAQWDKDDAQYKADMDSKQKALDSAKAQLDELQEQARKAGIRQAQNDKESANKDQDNNSKQTDQDKNK